MDTCFACVVACNHYASEDLKEQDVKMLERCIRLDRDCAAICSLAINAMASDSEFIKQICKLCADICIACAVECEKHAAHMEHCKLCAAACRKCAAECSEVCDM